MSAKLRSLCAALILMLLTGLLPVSDNLPAPFGTKRAEAMTATFSPISTSAGGISLWFHGHGSQNTSGEVNVTFGINLPPGIRVTNAVFTLAYFPEADWDTWHNFNFDGIPHMAGWLGWTRDGGMTYHTNWGQHTKNVTGLLGHYTGGNQQFTVNIPAVLTALSWGHMHISLGSFLLQITYQHAPSTPIISSPVPGTRHLNTVNLSATSPVIGGAAITYFWEHSLNGITWSHIGSTTTTLNWNIPSHIPEGTTIHLRTMAVANGMASAHSTPITFIRGTDPIEAARLAAEAALIAANNAAARAQTAINQTFFAGQTVGQIAHELRGISEAARVAAVEARDAARLDGISPDVTLQWANNKTATRASAATLHVSASDNRTPVGQLAYRITVNGASVLTGTGLPLSAPVPLGAGSGLRSVVVTVTDQNNNSAQKETRIWRLP